MKIFFYVQHLLGIGHLKRAAVLAAALRKHGLEVTLVSGGLPVRGIEVDIQLAPASAADLTFRTLLDQAGQPVDDEWKRLRAGALLDAWRAARADVLLVELFPFGRRQMRFELLPLLEDAKRLAASSRVRRPLIICSVRDLIQSRPEREAETVALAERFFDRILVHGDPRLGGFERTFGPARQLGKRLHYTGYVVAEAPAAGEHGTEVLVSAGGGAVGRRLLECAMLARGQTLLSNAPWRVIAGVNCAESDLRALERLVQPGIALERSRDDFTRLLGRCALSISQAGYNTVAEILQARVLAVLVPFAGGGESEQMLRARLLAEQGVVHVADEATLSPETLAEAVNRAARAPLPPAGVVDLDGARRSAELLKEWLQ